MVSFSVLVVYEESEEEGNGAGGGGINSISGVMVISAIIYFWDGFWTGYELDTSL